MTIVLTTAVIMAKLYEHAKKKYNAPHLIRQDVQQMISKAKDRLDVFHLWDHEGEQGEPVIEGFLTMRQIDPNLRNAEMKWTIKFFELMPLGLRYRALQGATIEGKMTFASDLLLRVQELSHAHSSDGDAPFEHTAAENFDGREFVFQIECGEQLWVSKLIVWGNAACFIPSCFLCRSCRRSPRRKRLSGWNGSRACLETGPPTPACTR